LKPDEQKIDRQFSYDLDANVHQARSLCSSDGWSANIAIQGVQWVFSFLTKYGGPDEFDPNAFVPSVSIISFQKKFPIFAGCFHDSLLLVAPKGIELTPERPKRKRLSPKH